MSVTCVEVLCVFQQGLSIPYGIGCGLEHVEPLNRVDYFVSNIADRLVPVAVDDSRDNVGVGACRVPCAADRCDGISGHDFLAVQIK